METLTREKMICCFLLLLTLTFCVCASTFVVKVTQSSYQAEENHNITLEWTVTNHTLGSLDSLIVYCELFTDDHNEPKVLYHLHEGDEDSEIQDVEFSGQVHCDRDVLREGRVRLHVSRLRTEDSGLYQCEVLTGYGSGSDECHLNVTAPTFVVKVTQSSYQAEENHNITLEWTFTTNTQGPSDSLIVYCRLFTDDQDQKVVYHLHEGDEKSQDRQFSGRVQCDRDVLREGRVRLHVSRLRTEDSGRYQCWVLTTYERDFATCYLNVTEAVDEPGPERPGPEGPGPEGPGPERKEPERQQPVSEGKVGLYLGLAIAAAVFLVLSLRLHLIKDEKKNVNTAEEILSPS